LGDDRNTGEKVADKAAERTTLPRGEIWLLRIAAATGVVSMLAHGLEFLRDIGLM
jgi:hypothetical protein